MLALKYMYFVGHVTHRIPFTDLEQTLNLWILSFFNFYKEE
jgi:hypothetical protein